MKKVLLVVDLQPEFVNDESRDAYKHVLDFVTHTKEYDQIIATRFVRGNTNFKRYLDWEFTSEPKNLEFHPDIIRDKTGYGLSDEQYLQLSRDYHYDIVGCETDACVYKLAMDLFDREFDFSVLYPYVFTSADINSELLLSLFTRNLGSAVVIKA